MYEAVFETSTDVTSITLKIHSDFNIGHNIIPMDFALISTNLGYSNPIDN